VVHCGLVRLGELLVGRGEMLMFLMSLTGWCFLAYLPHSLIPIVHLRWRSFYRWATHARRGKFIPFGSTPCAAARGCMNMPPAVPPLDLAGARFYTGSYLRLGSFQRRVGGSPGLPTFGGCGLVVFSGRGYVAFQIWL